MFFDIASSAGNNQQLHCFNALEYPTTPST